MARLAKSSQMRGANGAVPRATNTQDQPVRNANRGRRSLRAITQGALCVMGAARLSIAGAHDMLEGNLDVREAAVINGTSGRVLRANELMLRYGNKSGGMTAKK